MLAADTTVCVGDAILAKPADDADAARMLRLLSGREHRVLSAVALQSVGGGVTGLDVLSNREFEVMRLLVAGDTVAAIAEKLQLSAKTVANHQSAIRQKLSVETHTQLLRVAAQHGVAANGDIP